MSLGGRVQRVDLVVEHGAGEVEVDRPLPVRAPARRARGRRRRRRRSPGRRTTATVRTRCATATTRWRVRARRTDRAAPAAAIRRDAWGSSTAVARRRVAGERGACTFGATRAACSANDASVGAVERASRGAAARRASTMRTTVGRAADGRGVHPGLVGDRVRARRRRPAPHVHARSASSIGLAVNDHAGRRRPSDDARTCRSAGVTGSPSTSSGGHRRGRRPSRAGRRRARGACRARARPTRRRGRRTAPSVSPGRRVDREHLQSTAGRVTAP